MAELAVDLEPSTFDQTKKAPPASGEAMWSVRVRVSAVPTSCAAPPARHCGDDSDDATHGGTAT